MKDNLDQYIENLMPFIKNSLDERQKKEWGPIARKILNKSNISDKVDVSTWGRDDWNIFHEMYGNMNKKEATTDLFFSKTLPIKDILIIEDSQKIRVAVIDDYAQKVDTMKEDPQKPLIIAAVEYFNKNWSGIFAVILLYGEDRILLQYCGNNEEKILKQISDESLEKFICTGPLLHWYYMQLSFLNPAIKFLFSNPNTMRIPIKNKLGAGNRKRKCRYVKTYIIKNGDIKKCLYDSDKKINRKCLCWYVIGHWREYKTGQKIFIQGYWKGALKETKRNYDDGRERIIDAEVIE